MQITTDCVIPTASVDCVTPTGAVHLDDQDLFITNEDGTFDKRIYGSSTYFLEDYAEMPVYS